MASSDYSLPFLDLNTLVPQNLRNPMNKSLLDNLFNRFLTQDESVPLYGYVGSAPSSPDDKTPKIPQQSVERDINALIPVLSFQVGSEQYSFTAQDLIRKAEVLGISTDQSQWLYSQGNNYAPPIDYDKFTNFFNYYWVGTALPTTPVLAWNPTVAPEYYTIAAPLPTDLDKLNVVAATTQTTTLTGTGFFPQTWVVEFTSPTTFTVQATGPLVGFAPGEDLQGPFTLPTPADAANPFPGPWATDVFPVIFNVASASAPLLTFNVVRDIVLDGSGNPLGYESFLTGDKFTITAPFISSTYNVTFTGGPGTKGKIANVNSLDAYQKVDGVQLHQGDRVLVRHGTAADQGIYIVQPGNWTRAADFDVDTASAGARVFVLGGTQANSLFTSFASGGWYGWNLTATNTISNTNDWQQGNFWIHRSALTTAYDLNKITQAVRPIIEFTANVQLNSHVDASGKPSATGTLYKQSKSEFNQQPLFDLYRYDGTHSGLASTLFFYEENPAADIDVALQIRAKLSSNESSDFLFNHGMIDGLNGTSLLFYKDMAGALHTIWHAGYAQATIVDSEFAGTGNGTLVAAVGSNAFTAQQIWTLVATSPTTFSIVGSKVHVLPTPYDVVNVGALYSNGLVNVTITAGSTAFVVGDTFRFRVGNFETTRYVYRDSNQKVFDFFGGPTLDVNSVGAWQVPRMFYNNLESSNGEEVPEGTLYSHFQGILTNQLVTTPLNKAFGGSIKLWSEQENLLASLLMERDLTPISMIDQAQRQYEIGLNTLVDLYTQNIVQYFSKVQVPNQNDDVDGLLDWLLAIRAQANDVKTVLYDSTAAVIGFPATLPQLGVTPLEVPGLVFDNELGVTLLQAHDGHLSPQYVQDSSFRDRLFSSQEQITRSDGNVTAAVVYAPPAQPYKGQLWLSTTNNVTSIQVFDVLSDTSAAPSTMVTGDYWYNRPSNALFQWNGSVWVPVSNLLAPWVTLDMAVILNNLLLLTEQRLYAGISTEQREYFTEAEVADALHGSLGPGMERELATWAAANGYDPTAPDYIASDAFTWNYSSESTANFAPVNTATVPARWYNALQAHQATVAGVIPTSRPNLEPWKLMGFATEPGTWQATYGATVTPDMVQSGTYITAPSVNVVSYSQTPIVTPLAGLLTIDGVTLLAGQTVLLTSEASPSNNGPWIAATSGWTRASTPLVANTLIGVTGGLSMSGTIWCITATPATVNVDPVPITQVRTWTSAMWSAIHAARPTLKLSVDVNRDALLPPYVSSTVSWSVNALTNTIPPSPADPYQFGEGSPVETVWTKSIEYRYSMARALFRFDPLSFLGNCWGFEWVDVDGILYDGYDITVPGTPRFRLHGEVPNTVTRTLPIGLNLATGPSAFTLTVKHDAYTSTRAFSFSVKDQNGLLVGHLHEGVLSSISGNGYTLTNVLIEDQGQPFRVGDTFTISANADGSGLSVIFTPATYYEVLGFGQTFTQALRAASIDTNQGYAMEAYRGWDVHLGYRAGGLVSTDDLLVYTDQDTLPPSAYDLRFKKSPYAADLWAHALRVTVTQVGSAYTANGIAVPANGIAVPANDGSDWIFRVEGYNSRYLQLSYYEYNTSGEFITFQALSGAHSTRQWKQYSDRVDTVTGQLPLTITGLQNLVTFMFGYSNKLQDDGWRFQDVSGANTDATTGRIRNWQLEIEQLIDAVYAGIAPGQGHVCNPFIDTIWLDQPTGLLSEYFDSPLFDVTAFPAVFDTLGVKIKTHDLTVLRSRGSSQISATVPMFTVHAQVDEYEHLFVFNDLSQPSIGQGMIYDPFSGARIATIKLNGKRQAATTLRPEFGGHFLVGNEVFQNFQASTDKVAKYYDANTVFQDELSTKHAMALLGYSNKQYMTDLDLNDYSQFNFWRGLIQMKGTNASINAFLNNDRFQDAKLDEFWAYKVAEYGDSRSKIFPELKLSVNDTIQQFTKLIFDPTTVPADFNTFSVITADDETRWFSIDDLNGPTQFESQVIGSYSKTVAVGELIALDFVADQIKITTGTATQLNATTFVSTVSGPITIVGYGPATPKFNPIKLFNYIAAELITEIPQFHPAIGQHTPEALQSVNITSSLDPARYNSATQTTDNPNYDPLRAWGDKEVGRVWWDTSNLEYTPYSDYTIFSAVEERLSRWGTLADFATVDVVEWVSSPVAPSLYNAQAAIDAGNADLDPATRAEGTVYGAKTYVSNRVWSVRPIAWSHAGVALAAAHPAFEGAGGSGAATLSFLPAVNGVQTISLSSGTFSQLGITAGMHLGAWQQDDTATRPLSEFLILDGFTKYLQGVPSGAQTNGGLTGSVGLTVPSYTAEVGPLLFTSSVQYVPIVDTTGLPTGDNDVNTYVTITSIDGGTSDLVLIRSDRAVGGTTASYTTTVGQTFSFTSTVFGLTITLTVTNAGSHDSLTMANLIAQILDGHVTMLDATSVQLIVQCDATDIGAVDFTALCNDPDSNINNFGIGWRAWEVPTQAQLNSDSRVPNSSWLPYVGPFTAYTTVPISVVQDAATGASFTLNNGTVIQKYQTSWADWNALVQSEQEVVAQATGNVTFTVDAGITIDRISTYVNGVAQLSSTYSLVGTTVTVLNVPVGYIVTLIVRAYTPTATELAFDPTVKDDLTIQQRYKTDYQYVLLQQRNDDGTFGNPLYYFWVQGRTSASEGKDFSVSSVTQMLTTGPSQYLTFQNLDATSLVYNAVAIAGLNYVVTQDNTFKLRFTRNFTLRDDPNQLDLKDTHTEWTLIRPGQRTKIPEQLWNLMVNTACGQDPAGNVLPSPARASYDTRHGTGTRFGFGADQVLAPTDLVQETLLFTILNTQLVDDSGPVPMPMYMTFLDFTQADTWFATASSTRNILTTIWNQANVQQINELFFAVLNDMVASNYEMTDLFKTSRLSAYSIKVVASAPAVPTYE